MAHWKSGDRGTKLSLPFKLKADQDTRTVEGYASVFNVLDSDGDVVVPGAFQESITERFHEEQLIKMLWQHDPAEPMGLPVELREDSRGLFFKARVSDTQANLDRLKLMADKVVDRVSIGFQVLKAEEFEDDEAREQLSGIAKVLPLMRLTKLKLYEFSPVTFAANEKAVILAVKSQYGWVPTFDRPELWLGDRMPAPEDTKEAPDSDMSREELQQAREERSREYGIEVLDDGALTYPSGFPTELDQYGDPVNLKYPTDTKDRAANARVRFKQNADAYSQEESKRVVHTRIVEAELSHGIKPSYDPDDELDGLLPDALVTRIEDADEEDKSADVLDNQKTDQDIADCECQEGKSNQEQSKSNPEQSWSALAGLATEMKRQRQLSALADCATLLTNMTTSATGRS